MFYRRKIILALLESQNGSIEKIALQKLLFLFSKKQQKPQYDFIPFHFGCFSFSASADLKAMVNQGILNEDNKSFTKLDKSNYASKLTVSDKKVLSEVKNLYGKLSSNALMRHTYLNFKYYAINSKTAKELLNNEQYQKIIDARPLSSHTILFTIGYEGISLEEYLNRLIKNDIKLLIDVRNNPMSMKFGFSKSQIQKYCESLGIEYLHIPEVGIESQDRQELNSQKDYDKLFETYKSRTLPKAVIHQLQIFDLLEKKERVALTCFEANICQCHRKHLAESITSLPNWNYELKHI